MKTLKLLFTLCLITIVFTTFGQDVAIYVSDAGNFSSPPWQILKFDENGENPETYISENLVWPQDIVFLEDQEVVLISNLSTAGYISKHDINSGEFIENFASGISGPTRMKIGTDSLLYVLQWSNTNNKVLRYQLDGTFMDEFTSAGVMQSIGLDWDSDGNLYVSSYGGQFVQKFDTEGIDEGAFINSNLSGPTNIWFEENGDLMVVDYNAGNVKRFDSEGNYLGIYISGLNFPEGVAFYPDGNMLLGNGGTKAVRLFDDEGTYLEDFIPSGSGNLLTPNAVVIRDVTAVSIPEKHKPQIIITPTTGHKFTVSNELKNKLKSIQVYTISGVPIENNTLMENRTWYANDAIAGIYLIVAQLIDGRRITQKVLVQ